MDKPNGEREKENIPPYFSSVTFSNFIEAHRRTQPTRFDRSIMSNVAGGDQARILKALRFFGLSDEEDRPTKAFEGLESLDGDQMQAAWAALLRQAYPFLFSGFDLEKATHSQLEERFREQAIQGDTVRKAVGFFIGMARLAGLSLSPYFKTMRARGPRMARKSPQRPTSQKTERRSRGFVPPTLPPSNVSEAKRVEFKKGGQAKLLVWGDVFDLTPEERAALFSWVDAMTQYENESAKDA
jgi:hypothetical protein